VAFVLASALIVTAGYAVWLRGQLGSVEVVVEPAPVEDRRVLRADAFADLPGWPDDVLSEALPALGRSCDLVLRRDPAREMPVPEVAGSVADWRPVCESLVAAVSDEDVRRIFEERFTPVQVLNNADELGLFTGYYEPSMSGSRLQRSPDQVPLYRKPPDLVSVDLEQFHERYAGRRISGRVAEGTFKPYFERGDISTGALSGRSLELVWIDDPIDAFFLHIQGSGRVELAEGGGMRVGYAGQNGRPYFAIGRELVARGVLTREEVSMQSIRRWLDDNPEDADDVMFMNPSFVFFRELKGEGPVGTQGVPLTPVRSLAVDRGLLPLGVPVWLDTLAPSVDGETEQPLRRLLVTQDTGGAIKGPVRGDVFWGHGAEAEAIAGRMKHEGRLWLLLPNEVASRALGDR
jgi:membrane-bound lytic murein transglycosylase A